MLYNKIIENDNLNVIILLSVAIKIRNNSFK